MPSDAVNAHQRRRLYLALIQLVNELGLEHVTVRGLAGRAGVSTRTFYKHFVNLDACLAASYGEVMGDALHQSRAAQHAKADWPQVLRASIRSLMTSFAKDPRATRLVLIEIAGGGPSSRRGVRARFGELEEILVDGFALAPQFLPVPRHLVAGMAAGIIRVARKTALAGRSGELPALADHLVDWMLTLPDPELLRLQAPISRKQDTWRGCSPNPSRPVDPRATENIGDGDRGRLLRGAAKMAEGGYRSLTASNVRVAAGVSRRHFEASFDDVRSCFLESVAMIATAAAIRAQGRATEAKNWQQRTSGAVLALAAQVANDRTLARLLFTELHATGSAGLVERESIVTRAAVTLRQTMPPEGRPSELAVEASVAASWHIAQAEVVSGRVANLPAVAPLLAYVLLAPVVGSRTATLALGPEPR